MSPSQYQPTSQQIVLPPDVNAPLSTRSLGPDIVPAQLHLVPRPVEPVIHANRSKKTKQKKEEKKERKKRKKERGGGKRKKRNRFPDSVVLRYQEKEMGVTTPKQDAVEGGNKQFHNAVYTNSPSREGTPGQVPHYPGRGS